ncbi:MULTISPECIES: hypothetical protein [unclassified Streptomyces]|uniref:hypothetical protein n=1 Tax=unclassified Streptomyces TaxID=2593676 RepID=UPI002DDC5B16|nr:MULTISPECIES: hypothetical protein [unclassified Streptomyces]WSA95449.1 hypothetical protein OIE63_30730 [Streptomyces sp. NBC_01795]WSB79865.1 hypothetical protein OHB04_31835 [Streptomyces sp. NBC_01775]WSS11928.1 hypothetical protein OG533_08375 [Streptomyces sp. NBC_01186]WSS40642.1 hypothetical protein OG220_08535 [Streptomyces sp. NBC_01187]
MSKPPHLRRATGTARGGSIVDKDRRAESAQADRRADLLERMRQRAGTLPTGEKDRPSGR